MFRVKTRRKNHSDASNGVEGQRIQTLIHASECQLVGQSFSPNLKHAVTITALEGKCSMKEDIQRGTNARNSHTICADYSR